ncbi:MAG: hypothetical protein KQA34_02460 [Candidatus Aenigmarchaeota archaeon]|nr:hypothetical protein [Candidatus Aenigmarchaeota archaeon]
MIVRDIKIREIFSHNLKETIEVEVEISKGKVRASVPIGTSRGVYEVEYLPTKEVIKNFLEIREKFRMKEFKNFEEVDNTILEYDKSEKLNKIGGNLALAISLAMLKAFALHEDLEVFEYVSSYFNFKIKIPKPVCNVIGGGKHFGGSDFQEFLLIGKTSNFKEEIKKIINLYFKIAERLKKEDRSFNFGRNLESAWITNLSTKRILEILRDFSKEYELYLGIDVAASSFYDFSKGMYVYEKEGLELNRIEQLSYLYDLIKDYEIFYIEDPFYEEDFVSFATLLSHFSQKLIVGDDLTVTNLERLKKASELKSINGIIIKPNQIGLITKVAEVIKFAKKNDIKVIFSHRSGETEDPVISQLAVGFGSEYIKLGIAGERTIKINEILRIEEKILG